MRTLSRTESLATAARPAAPVSPEQGGLRRADLGLYATVVFVWGTSWIAIHYQLGVVPPEVSLVWRFALASVLTGLWAVGSGVSLRQPAAMHVFFAGLGLFLFSCNFLFFYYGGLAVPSGLLAVVFSLASIVNMILAATVFRQPVEMRLAAGGVLGALGVACMFAPQILGQGLDRGALVGLALCIGGTLFFCCGNLLATEMQRRRVPALASSTWGMAYGTLILVAIALFNGSPFIIEWTPAYLGGLVWLAVAASVIAFAAYLRLLSRIGATRASYTTVLFPVVALAMSTLLEGYRWTLPAFAGLALVLAGNLLVLLPRRGR